MMKSAVKGLVVLAAMVASGSSLEGVSAAGTTDFFECPGGDLSTAQVSRDSVLGYGVIVQSCVSPYNGRVMYRGNVFAPPHNGDILRVKYRRTGVWVEHSYRSAPHDVDKNREMPGEWYFAGELQGREISACLDPEGVAANRVCT